MALCETCSDKMVEAWETKGVYKTLFVVTALIATLNVLMF